MKAHDVMTSRVITTTRDATVEDAVRLMLEHRISGLPVVDDLGHLVGIVTEADFLHRAETGTMRKRARWLEYLIGPRTLAADYVHGHGRRIDEVMTPNPVTVDEDASLDEVVALMERRRIKRVPVVCGGQVVGIISRANLLQAFAAAFRPQAAPAAAATDDQSIRRHIGAELKKEIWAPVALVDVTVRDGVVTLSGTVTDDRQADGLRVLCENVPGVKSVEDNLTWIEPMSGTVVASPEERRAAS